MKTLLFTTLSMLLFITTALPQRSAPGYYINFNRDTRGIFKNYKDWAINPASVLFSAGNGQPDQTLTPTNCRYFVVDRGDAYESYRVTLITNELSDFTDPDTTTRYETVTAFLRLIYQSQRFQLFEYNNGRRLNYFVKDGNKAPEELRYKAIKDNRDFTEANDFRVQLQRYMAAEPRMQTAEARAQLQDLSYNAESLVPFFNGMQGPGIDVSGRTIKKARFRVLGGLAISRLSASTEQFPTLPAEDKTRNYSSPSSSPVFGFGITVFQKRGFGKNFIDLSVQGYSFKHSSKLDVPILNLTKTVQQKATLLELNIMLGRNFVDTKWLSWYVAPILSVNALTNAEEKAETRNENMGTTNTRTTENNKTAYVISLQTGVRLRSMLGVWVRYKPQVQFNGTANYINKHSSLQFGVDVSFGKQ